MEYLEGGTLSLRRASLSAIASMRSWIHAGVFFDPTPAYHRTALPMCPPPFRRFPPRPLASAPSPLDHFLQA